MTAAKPARNEYSERRLTSMNGYAMRVLAIALVGIALSRFVAIRDDIDAVALALKTELSARFASAGVTVTDARLTHLAYAPEIAQVMLRRQQAEAVISARHEIVHGGVAMVSNLLVVLCGDKDTQPIINAGTLYS